MLNLKVKEIKKLTLNLRAKKRVEFEAEVETEEIEEIDEEEAREIGFWDTANGIRLGKGPDWELWLIPLNYVLKEKGDPKYFSSFESLLHALKEHRIKYHLIQERYNRIEVAMEKASEDIQRVCKNLDKIIKFIDKRYQIS